MPTTLALTCLAVALALAVAVPVGIYSAVFRNTVGDHAATVVVFLGQSMPVFWIGIMLMLLFAVQWRLLGGAVLPEGVFAVPGVGRLIVGAIRQLDFPIVQAGVFLLAMIIVSVNLFVDVLYVYLNPTVRLR